MTGHEEFVTLALRATTEQLPPAESAALEEHLQSCRECRSVLAAMRRDDDRLRAMLAEEDVAPRVRQAVMDAAAGRRRRATRPLLALAAALVVGLVSLPILLGGGPVPGPSVTPSVSASVSPSESPTATPSTPTASPSAAVIASVNGVYSYTTGPGETRRDSVAARLEPGPAGEWSRMDSATGGGVAFGGPLTCLVIDGRDAWMAGPATTATDGSTGRSAFLYIHDGGPGGAGDTAVLWMNDPGQTLATMEGWCMSRFIPAGPFPLDDGDVTVESGPG